MTASNELRYLTQLIQLDKPVFALYDIISDCFLIVASDQRMILDLKYIVSSRYNLHVCRLDTAGNYVSAQISNLNCDQWALTNRQVIKFSDPLSETITTVTELRLTKEVPQYNVFNEKQWCLFCAHCLFILSNKFDNMGLAGLHSTSYAKTDNFLNSFLNITEIESAYPMVTPAQRDAVLKLLYLGRDLENTEAEVKKIVDYI
jgi:hypothetical protein